MFRRLFAVAVMVGLASSRAVAQPNQEFVELLKKGSALLDAMPDVPADLDEEYFYKFESKEEPVGWQHIKLDSIEKKGERFYRYRCRYGFNGVDVGWGLGQMTVLLDKKLTPMDIRNELELITPNGGKREVSDRARIKNDKFQRRYFDGRQTKKFKFEYKDVNAVFLAEPLLGHIKAEPGKKFALTNYDVVQGRFETVIYEAVEESKGRVKLKTEFKYAVEDPSKSDKVEVIETLPPAPENEDEEEEDKEKKEDKESYYLIDPDKAVRFQNLPNLRMQLRRIDRERLDEVKKKLEIKESDITTT